MTGLISVLGGTMVQDGAAGLQTGADPSVLEIASNPRTGSGLDLTPYSIPAETGSTVQVAVTGDDRQAFIDAWNSLPAGGPGIIEIDRRLLFDNNTQNDLNGKDNVTVKGTTTDAGIAADTGVATGSSFRSLLEIPDASNVVIRDLEFDSTGQNIGCITPFAGTNLWLVRLWCHDIGGTPSAHPLAAVKGGGSGPQELNVVGCVFEDGFGTGADPSVRGLWSIGDGSPSDWLENSLIEHNIVRNMGHTGFALHCDVGGVIVRRNTSYDNIGAGFKPEIPNGASSSFDPGIVVQTYELNYSAGNGFTGFQVEGVGVLLFRNYIENQSNAMTSFEDFRRTEISENLCTNIDGDAGRPGAIFLDGSDTRDRTNNLIANNTIETGTGSPDIIHGVYVHPDHVNFSNGDPYVIEDNLILDTSGAPFLSANATFDAFIAGDPSSRVQNNNGTAPGTPVTLIRPSYAP